MTLQDDLQEQERAWQQRPLLRKLYRGWFREIGARLAQGGPTIELGAGIAKLQEVVPQVVTTDVEPTPWTERVVDAERLPYADGAVANLVLVDVFHHLPSPAAFLAEAARALRKGGRVVILDPYCSPISTVAYKALHHERTDLAVTAFGDDDSIRGDPMASNQARATLAFFRHRDEYADRFPSLPVVERRRFAFLLYPLSGGFTKPPLLPEWLQPPVTVLERALRPAAPLLAFRCLVVLERR